MSICGKDNMTTPRDPPPPAPESDGLLDGQLEAEFGTLIEAWHAAHGPGANVEQQEAIAWRLMTLAAEKHSTRTKPSRGDEYREEIRAAEKRLDWEASIALQRELIAWEREHEPYALPWKTMVDLSSLLWICGRRAEAIILIEEAHQLGLDSNSSIASLYTAPNAARYFTASGRAEEAERLIEEALAVARSPDRQAAGVRGTHTLRLRLRQASLAWERGELSLAQQLLEALLPELEPFHDSGLMAGMRSMLAWHARLRGRLSASRGEWESALQAYEESGLHLGAVLQMPQISRPYQVLYEIAELMLLSAEAADRIQPGEGADLRAQALERFAELKLPPGISE